MSIWELPEWCMWAVHIAIVTLLYHFHDLLKSLTDSLAFVVFLPSFCSLFWWCRHKKLHIRIRHDRISDIPTFCYPSSWWYSFSLKLLQIFSHLRYSRAYRCIEWHLACSKFRSESFSFVEDISILIYRQLEVIGPCGHEVLWIAIQLSQYISHTPIHGSSVEVLELEPICEFTSCCSLPAPCDSVDSYVYFFIQNLAKDKNEKWKVWGDNHSFNHTIHTDCNIICDFSFLIFHSSSCISSSWAYSDQEKEPKLPIS